MSSFLPPNAAAPGVPPPTALATQVMSGVTPYSSWAPPSETRKPVMISSKMSTTSFSSQMRRSPSRNPGTGGMMPASPRIGSASTQASWSRLRLMSTSTASMSLNGAMTIVSSMALGMPAPDGSVRGNFSVPAAPSAGTCE